MPFPLSVRLVRTHATADADERPKTKRGGAKEKNQQAPRRRTDRPTERVVVVVDGRVRQSTTDVSTTG